MSGWWAGGGGQRGGEEGVGGCYQPGGIRASQGTFSSFLNVFLMKCSNAMNYKNVI